MKCPYCPNIDLVESEPTIEEYMHTIWIISKAILAGFRGHWHTAFMYEIEEAIRSSMKRWEEEG